MKVADTHLCVSTAQIDDKDPCDSVQLCTGANDYFSIVFQNTSVTAQTVTGYISDAMQQLYSRGARK